MPGDVVLDVGTGSGAAALEVCKAVPSVSLVVGIDRSEAMIKLARRKVSLADLRNLRFHKMSAEDLHFPDGFFDVAISNCGIAVAQLTRCMRETLRVLRPGGHLVFNDWHLVDVKAHQVFGEVLEKYRTRNPSPALVRERSALATMEHFHHSLSSGIQRKLVSDVGFADVSLVNRRRRIRLPTHREFMRMRLTRLTVKRETSEMPNDQRKRFMRELRQRLQAFVVRNRFVFDWELFYISAKKPR